MKASNVIACLLCPKDAEGYYPEFAGPDAGDGFRAHLAEAHAMPAETPIARVMILHLTMDKGYQSNYWLHEQAPDGSQGRRIGAQRIETPRKGYP
jgi:hypothetical protein